MCALGNNITVTPTKKGFTFTATDIWGRVNPIDEAHVMFTSKEISELLELNPGERLAYLEDYLVTQASIPTRTFIEQHDGKLKLAIGVRGLQGGVSDERVDGAFLSVSITGLGIMFASSPAGWAVVLGSGLIGAGLGTLKDVYDTPDTEYRKGQGGKAMLSGAVAGLVASPVTLASAALLGTTTAGSLLTYLISGVAGSTASETVSAKFEEREPDLIKASLMGALSGICGGAAGQVAKNLAGPTLKKFISESADDIFEKMAVAATGGGAATAAAKGVDNKMQGHPFTKDMAYAVTIGATLGAAIAAGEAKIKRNQASDTQTQKEEAPAHTPAKKESVADTAAQLKKAAQSVVDAEGKLAQATAQKNAAEQEYDHQNGNRWGYIDKYHKKVDQYKAHLALKKGALKPDHSPHHCTAEAAAERYLQGGTILEKSSDFPRIRDRGTYTPGSPAEIEQTRDAWIKTIESEGSARGALRTAQAHLDAATATHYEAQHGKPSAPSTIQTLSHSTEQETHHNPAPTIPPYHRDVPPPPEVSAQTDPVLVDEVAVQVDDASHEVEIERERIARELREQAIAIAGAQAGMMLLMLAHSIRADLPAIDAIGDAQQADVLALAFNQDQLPPGEILVPLVRDVLNFQLPVNLHELMEGGIHIGIDPDAVRAIVHDGLMAGMQNVFTAALGAHLRGQIGNAAPQAADAIVQGVVHAAIEHNVEPAAESNPSTSEDAAADVPADVRHSRRRDATLFFMREDASEGTRFRTRRTATILDLVLTGRDGSFTAEMNRGAQATP